MATRKLDMDPAPMDDEPEMEDESPPQEAPAAMRRLRAFAGASQIGVGASVYRVGKDGCIEVAAEHVAACIAAGFTAAD